MVDHNSEYNLEYIKFNFVILPGCLIRLELSGRPLVGFIKIVTDFQNKK